MTQQSTASAFSPPPRGRGLSRGLKIFLAVDVVLVLVFVAILVTTRAGEEPSSSADPVSEGTETVAPETTPEASAPPAPSTSQELADFVLPSGNIFCSMTADAATCTILEHSFEAAPAPEGCAAAAGTVFTVTAADGASVACVEAAPTGPPADAPELTYGEGSTVGEMTCLSSRNGVFCRHDPSGAGFSLARAGYQFF